MFTGNYWERNKEREILRLSRFPNRTAKSYFLHCSPLYFKISLQFPLGIVGKHAQKKQVYCWLKNKEPGEQKVRFWTVILMFIFHEKCQSLGQVKMQNLTCNTPLFLVLASPWTILKTDKRKLVFSWEMKNVSGHLTWISKTYYYPFLVQFSTSAAQCRHHLSKMLRDLSWMLPRSVWKE